MALGTNPQFSPMYGGFAALRAAVGGSWTSPGMQQPDGKRLILVAMTPRQRHRGHRGRAAARTSAKELHLRPKSSRGGLAAFNGAATVVLVLLGVWEVQEARACRICACMWSVYVLEAPLAHVHPYVACIFVEMYFLALSMCRIVQ